MSETTYKNSNVKMEVDDKEKGLYSFGTNDKR